ncbi:aminoglycoside adenylyltransferase domain-containing protein [Micromonospora sp. NPDC048170]|uniref:aminoglycoside adenylyltransferase domain-containing protein n=1 Tax=Micromonospora sp. NPDC048170 TaxID=3154819 RepID=UPI0033E43D37
MNAGVTPQSSAAALTAARHLAWACADIVGPSVRSVILHGSLAAGDFHPGRSDIDLLVVAEGALSDAQADALEILVRQADLGGASGIDLHVVAAKVAGAPTRMPPMELHIGRYDGSSIGVEVESRVAAAPDLPAELSMARADGHALVGAQPHDVIAPVRADWIRERGRHWLKTWRSHTDDAEDAVHMVLTACRIWRFTVDGTHSSKSEAARWALNQDPSLTAIRQAVHQYTVDPAAPVDAAGIARVLNTALRETAPASSHADGGPSAR